MKNYDSSLFPENSGSECKEVVDADYHINEVTSWIQSNMYLLSEAKDETCSPFKRIESLTTFSGNLDDFFMIRVSRLHQPYGQREITKPPDGHTLAHILDEIYDHLSPVLEDLPLIWNQIILDLHEQGIFIHTAETLTKTQTKLLRDIFQKEIFPVLTPLAFDRSHPFPFISNQALNLAIIVQEQGRGEDLFVRIKIPHDLFPRLLPVPDGEEEPGFFKTTHLIFLEDLISANLDIVFPGMKICESYPFRVTRDANIWIEEESDEEQDLAQPGYPSLKIGIPVRIEISSRMDRVVCGMICDKLIKYSRMFYRTDGPVGMADLTCLLDINRSYGDDSSGLINHADTDLNPLSIQPDQEETRNTPAMYGSFYRFWRFIRSFGKNM
jgi:polyphosphate kinase